MILSAFRRSSPIRNIQGLYGAIVAQARAPIFYLHLGVPDSVEGRFELIVLGTPSTVATVSGEAFYYISQTATRAASFMPTTITDQRVVAIYFDKDRRVQRVADYGMKDGRVFDFVSRTTPTAGSDASLIKQLFSTLQNSKFTLPF